MFEIKDGASLTDGASLGQGQKKKEGIMEIIKDNFSDISKKA